MSNSSRLNSAGHLKGLSQEQPITVANLQAMLNYFNALNTGKYSLPVYANNAAAVAGGLQVGGLYRTGSDPDTVNIVH